MKTRFCAALFLAFVLGTTSHAARLVVVAVNSGTSNPPSPGSGPPIAPAGAKGFLIAVDNTSDPADLPMGIGDLTFFGPNIVQRLAPNASANGSLSTLHVQTRAESLIANAEDPIAGSTFGRNDSWWWNASQNRLTLSPVSTGIQGGLPGGPMSMTGTFNLSGDVPPGLWRTAYIVATGDVWITGLIAVGTDSRTGSFNPLGLTPSDPRYFDPVLLDFETGKIVPEPASLAIVLFSSLGIAMMVRREIGRA